MPQTKKTFSDHQLFVTTLMFISMLFRVYVIFIIAVFLGERSGSTAGSILLPTLVTGVLIGGDIFMTLESVYKRLHDKLFLHITYMLKLGLILLLFMYSISIGIRFWYWLYPAFGIFLAFLYMTDISFIKVLADTRSQRK